MFYKLLPNLSIFFLGKVPTNITCFDQLTAGMVILQLPLCRIFSHIGAYVTQVWRMVPCVWQIIVTQSGTGMTIPWTFTDRDCATFRKSDWLLLAVIIFQSACVHPMLNSLATSSLIKQMYDPPSVSLGGMCPCIVSRTVEEALVYCKPIYSEWYFGPVKTEMWAIPIFFVVASILAVTHLSLQTGAVLSCGSSQMVILPASLSWRARIEE